MTQTLTEKTIADLREFFNKKGTNPGDSLWWGISGLALSMEEIIKSSLPPMPFVSCLDPGVGKTKSATHFIKNLLNSSDHKSIAVLYCVSRLNEVKALVEDIGNGVGVLTGDRETNKLGTKEPFEARVLITTQQLVDSRLSNVKRFADLSEFHYLGKPRLLKIWDESLLPAEALTLNIDSLRALPRSLVKVGFREQSILKGIRDVGKAIEDKETDTKYAFPDLRLDYDYIMGFISEEKDTELRKTARVLCLLQGKDVRVRRDNLSGNTVLDYQNTLPEDFFPVVILDASGRVRHTYHLWAKYRKNLLEIRGGTKTYDRLRIHLWNKGGGKASWKRNSPILLDGVVSTINSKPEEKWLVILHKKDQPLWFDKKQKHIPDLEAEIKVRAAKPENVRFLTWGNAHATNDYVDCTNVILAGTLFYPEAYYEATARASMGLSHDEKLDLDTYKDLELGEHMHLILQAACRGSVRLCEGDRAMPMNLYIIAKEQTGITPTMLKTIFPGCDVMPWEPVAQEFRGDMRRVKEYLLANFKTPEQEILCKEICASLDIAKSSNLNRILKDKRFEAFMKEADIWFTSKNGQDHERKDRLIWKPGPAPILA
jgi:hypothetical protein